MSMFSDQYLQEIEAKRVTFVQDLVALDQRQEYDDAVDLIFELFDTLYHEGRFKDAGELLDQINCQHLSTFSIVGLLSAANWAKDELGPVRTQFVERARQQLLKLAPDRIEGLMRGLDD